jgi:hypothetical protein
MGLTVLCCAAGWSVILRAEILTRPRIRRPPKALSPVPGALRDQLWLIYKQYLGQRTQLQNDHVLCSNWACKHCPGTAVHSRAFTKYGL